MKKGLIEFIEANNLSPFNRVKVATSREGENIFQTTDAKKVFAKVLSNISSNFVFPDTTNLLNAFVFTQDEKEIIQRQKFISDVVSRRENDFLKKIVKPRSSWKPKYDVVVVTEDENTYLKLQGLSCPSVFIVNENDILGLENYDLVQVVDVDLFSGVLERLPQSVFLDSVDDVYLERYLEQLSGWRENFGVVSSGCGGDELQQLVSNLQKAIDLLENRAVKKLSREEVENGVEKINELISEKLKAESISGMALVKILSEKVLPENFRKIVESSIDEVGLPRHLFNIAIPVEIDDEEVDAQIKRESANEFTNIAVEIKKNSSTLKAIPKTLREFESLLIYEDFCSGVKRFLDGANSFPCVSDILQLENVSNLFLKNAQPVSFHLDKNNRCSILTGANSGGKTTLLENVIQNIVLFQLGLSTGGKVAMPFFSEVYYFAKNKGSASKGAFETLLTQMSEIIPGERTLILADEIESVTEPGVAGEIISATADYFIRKNCYLIIATHLGHEIQKSLPKFARIDGIEATGLDENFNLIVNHNPVLGRLANSTPELIVERMANAFDADYFKFLRDFLKKRN